MFILRKINGKGIESNICLNKVYNVVYEHNDQEEFLKANNSFHGVQPWETIVCPVPEEVYAYIIYDDGSKIEPLYKIQKNYIMMSDGKTFDNLSFRY